MKPVIVLAAALAGGVAGSLLTRALADDAPARQARGDAPRVHPDVEQRLAALERAVARQAAVERRGPASPADGSEGGGPAAGASAPARADSAPESPQTAKKGAITAFVRKELGEITRGLDAAALDDAQIGRLWTWMTENRDKIPGLIAGLEEQLKERPSADLYAVLATAYIGELNYNTPQGAQQGLVWGKASEAYDAAIKLDNEHWHSRYGKAFGLTFVPPQFGARPIAIKQFEELREIQDRRAPEPNHARTYEQLGRLYVQEGNAEAARKVWREGLKRFPDNENLKRQLDVSEKK